jgi:predicted TIM-barrel fold metal-dependent hydrolase
VLDPHDTYRGCLTYNVGEFGCHFNPYFASDLCRAANDWTIERWLSRDERLYGGIVVGPQLPDEAVAEIYRLADHPRMACVVLAATSLYHPLGHPLYHPIYAAAADVGLPVAIHVGGGEFGHLTAPGGKLSTLIEVGSVLPMAGPHYLSSFIVHGVFEKYPSLRVLLNEFTLSWLPGVLWNLERDFELLRLESPWVKRRPTEYVHDHIKFSTQPLEAVQAEEGRRLVQLLETVDGIEDLLCFSSDYPHQTMDDVAFVERILPRAWHAKVFCENACKVYGWTPPTGVKSRRGELANV